MKPEQAKRQAAAALERAKKTHASAVVLSVDILAALLDDSPAPEPPSRGGRKPRKPKADGKTGSNGDV